MFIVQSEAAHIVAHAVGAAAIAVVAVVIAVVGGPRRRLLLRLGVEGGRVRLPARTLERILIVAACAGVVSMLGAVGTLVTGDAAALAVVLSAWSAVVIIFAIRRGAFLALRPGLGPDRHDDGYVDAETDGRHGV